MKKTVLFMLLVVGLTKVAFADYLMISDVGTSAKMIGIGNIEGFSESASAIFDNPAGLLHTRSSSLAMFTTKLFDEVTFSNLNLATRTAFGTFGIGYMEAAVRDIANTGKMDSSEDVREPFYALSYFDYKNTILKAAYQVQFPWPWANSDKQIVSLGASVGQYSVSYFNTHGRGLNMDVGALIELETLAVSLAAKNVLVNVPVTYSDGSTEKLPLQLVCGLKYDWYDLDLLMQVKRLSGQNLTSAGVVYTPPFAPFMQFSAGYKQVLGPGIARPKSNGTTGVALRLDGFQLHYAYEKSEVIEFDNKNYFSVSVDL